MHSKWVLCMHQLKAAPTHPGCYINHSADISKSFHRRVAIKQTWGGGDTRKSYCLQSFLLLYRVPESSALLCFPRTQEEQPANKHNGKKYSPGVVWGSFSCTDQSPVANLECLKGSVAESSLKLCMQDIYLACQSLFPSLLFQVHFGGHFQLARGS